jgi:pimeloyl-ACP methyl ester carboxylesterase
MIALVVLGVLAAGLGGLAVFTARVVRRVEAVLPPAGRFVELPGARLHVVERGQGPAILLIHGLAGQLGHFTYALVDDLARDFRVVAVDRPGSGYSQRAPGASAALGAQAEVLVALMDRLGMARPLVVGHSLGGALALALAQRHPDRVRGLALLAPLTQILADVPAIFRALTISRPWLRALTARTVAVPLTIVGRVSAVRVVFGPDAMPGDYGTRGGGLLALRPSHFIAACEDLAAIPDELPGVMQGYAAMKLPVGVLYGRGDRVLDPQVHGAALAAQLPGARLTLIEGGHMLPVTAPARCAQFIREAAAQGLPG